MIMMINVWSSSSSLFDLHPHLSWNLIKMMMMMWMLDDGHESLKMIIPLYIYSQNQGKELLSLCGYHYLHFWTSGEAKKKRDVFFTRKLSIIIITKRKDNNNNKLVFFMMMMPRWSDVDTCPNVGWFFFFFDYSSSSSSSNRLVGHWLDDVCLVVISKYLQKRKIHM